MKQALKHKFKIIIVFGALFIVIIALILLIFFAGKKTYTVTFDLNGGTLLSGSVEQRVTQGQNASPPTVTKDGAFFLKWSTSYREVTKDLVIEAVWEYETTPGIIYSNSENQNYCEIIGSYERLNGDVYIGAYYNDKKVLSIKQGAFENRVDITKVYLLNGLITLENHAFAGCKKLTSIEIPETVTKIDEYAFADCTSLETLIINEGVTEIGAYAFSNCSSLTEVIIPKSVIKIDANAFAGCHNLIIKTPFAENEKPILWNDAWFGSATIEWEYVPEDETEEIKKS